MTDQEHIVGEDALSGHTPPAKKHTSAYAVTLLAGFCFFGLISPKSLPLPLLLVSFLVVGFMLYSSVRLLMQATSFDNRLPAFQRRAIIATAVVLPVLLLMLQSLGQLTMRDVVTLILLFAIGFFYFERMLKKQ